MKSLREKLENAAKDLLAVEIEDQVVTGVDSGQVSFPYVLCVYEEGESFGPQTGLTRATIQIQAVSAAKPGTDSKGDIEHNRLFGKVVEVLEVDDLAEQLTQAGDDLLVVGIESTTEDTTDVEDREDIDIFTSNYSIQLIAGHR